MPPHVRQAPVLVRPPNPFDPSLMLISLAVLGGIAGATVGTSHLASKPEVGTTKRLVGGALLGLMGMGMGVAVGAAVAAATVPSGGR